MKLTALKTFRLGSQNYRRGSVFEVSDTQAQELIAGKVAAAVSTPVEGKRADEDLAKLTKAQLLDLAKAENTAVETDDNKASLIDKITAARTKG